MRQSQVDEPISDQEISDLSSVSPTQRVSVIRDEQQLNVWIPKDLMKRLKVRGAESDKSLKELVTEALLQFL